MALFSSLYSSRQSPPARHIAPTNRLKDARSLYHQGTSCSRFHCSAVSVRTLIHSLYIGLKQRICLHLKPPSSRSVVFIHCPMIFSGMILACVTAWSPEVVDLWRG